MARNEEVKEIEMNNVIGVLGQPGRIKPVTYPEKGIAIHEAGHAVFCHILNCSDGLGRVSIRDEGDGVWTGRVQNYDGPPVPKEDWYPKFDSTMPYYWELQAREMWGNILVQYAGSAAVSVWENADISAASIRLHHTGESDERYALFDASHYWPAEHQQAILDKAAEIAGFLCCMPQVWKSIKGVAEFLNDNGRNKANIFETGVIVRQFIPGKIPSPFEDWAVSLRRQHTTPAVAIPQPARIAPPTNEELGVAFHEGGHAVFCQILPGVNDFGRAKIWKDGHSWTGFVGPNSTREMLPIEEIEDISFPAQSTATEKEWADQARRSWAILLVSFAGAAAEVIFNGENLSAPSIRWHPAASTDAVIAGKAAAHYFDDKHVEEILDRAAETAVALCQVPVVWGAITELAKFLVDHGRGESSIYETSVIVRNHISNPLKTAPGEEWAMQFVRKQGALL
ncbi:MAG: hypothetical protein HY777_16700 [Betaproteobacteria bacterium]|nr:hypothetical protein [Betaproteobacteria bacterium]